MSQEVLKVKKVFMVYQMKRIVLTILALVYFALSVRATVHLHDCMDIFADAITDIHSPQNEKKPCKNDPGQCELENQRRITEAPSKSLRVIDQLLVPASAFSDNQRFCIQRQGSPTAISFTVDKTSLLSFLCVWRI